MEQAWQVDITVAVNMADDIAGLLIDDGALAVEEKQAPSTEFVQLRAMYAHSDDPSVLPERVESVLAEMGVCSPTQISVDQAENLDWQHKWKEFFEPLEVAPDVWIIPSWKPDFIAPNGAIQLHLDPGMAFGTGQHASTQLALQDMRFALQQCDASAEVLDVGCGSGILAIAAIKFGASHAFGIDIDPDVIDIACENARQNQVSASTVFRAGEIESIDKTYVCVVANILATTLCEIATSLVQRVQSGGWLILSGILAEEADHVVQTFKQADHGSRSVQSVGVTEKNGWAGILLHIV